MTSLLLTPMQAKVADCLGRGLSYAKAATELGIAADTVKNHTRAAALKIDNPDQLPPKTLVSLHGAHAAWELLKKAG